MFFALGLTTSFCIEVTTSTCICKSSLSFQQVLKLSVFFTFQSFINMYYYLKFYDEHGVFCMKQVLKVQDFKSFLRCKLFQTSCLFLTDQFFPSMGNLESHKKKTQCCPLGYSDGFQSQDPLNITFEL